MTHAVPKLLFKDGRKQSTGVLTHSDTLKKSFEVMFIPHLQPPYSHTHTHACTHTRTWMAGHNTDMLLGE